MTSWSTDSLLRPPRVEDARALFSQIHRTSVVDSILWDGPESQHDYVTRYGIIVDETRAGSRHFFCIVAPESGDPIGSCDVRPDAARSRATLGIWIGAAHQGRGLGTRAIAELVRYAFDELSLHELAAEVFVGNWPSRRAFEKNGFVLEGTIRAAVVKRGVPRDEWHLVLVRPSSPPHATA